MLILPPGHAQAVRTRRAFSARERWMIGGVLSLVAAVIVGLVISLAAAGHHTSKGCIDYTLAYATGGENFYRCGASARYTCAKAGAPGGLTGGAARAVATECRKAGLPVG
jgi:hypothetical protein